MRSLRLLCVLLGASPLALLTGVNVLATVRKESESVVPDVKLGFSAEEVAKNASFADETLKQVAAEKPVLEKLAKMDLLGRSAIPDIPAAASDVEIDKATTELAKLKKALDAGQELGKLYRRPLTEPAEVAALDGFLSGPALKNVPGAEPLRDHLAERQQKLKDMTALANTLTTLRTALEDGRFKETLDIHKRLPRSELNAPTIRECDEIAAHATFWLYWATNKDPSATDPLKTQRAKLELVIKDSPPALNSKEQDHKKVREDRLAQLRSRIRVEEFFDSPPKDFRSLLEGCEDIFKEDPASKGRLRDELRKHLEARLPMKQLTGLGGEMQEARRKGGGEFVVGVFKVNSGAANKQSWFYSKTLADSKLGRFETIYLTDLEAPPGVPKNLEVVSEFNAKRGDLLRQMDSQRRWTDFEKLSIDWQERIDAYNAARPGSPAVKFDDGERLAREVLQFWSRISVFLGE